MDYRLIDFLHPVKIIKCKRFLDKSQWFDEDELIEYQNSKLRNLIKHAYKNVPYYSELFDKLGLTVSDIKTQEDLEKLPILTKDIIRENFDKLIAKNFIKISPSIGVTSGSTGTPLKLYYDTTSNIFEFCTILRFSKWGGYKFGDKVCDIRGRVFKNKKNWRVDWKLRRLQLSSFDLRKENVDLYVSKLNSFKPAIIRGYPSSLYVFATWLKEKSIRIPKPKCVVTASETLLDFQKDMIENVFDSQIYDYYGSTERVVFVSHCEKQKYHIHPEYGILELLDENGKKISINSPNKTGEVIGTSLHNYLFPMIRYRMNDLIVTDNSECSCDRNFPTIKEIIGRIEDVVVTPDGRYVGRLDRAFGPVEGIVKSQIVQDSKQKIIIKIVKTSRFDNKNKELLLRELRYRLGDKIKIEFEFVNDIPVTKGGKLKFVISKIKSDIRRFTTNIQY